MCDDLINQQRGKLALSFGFFSAELLTYIESMWWEHMPRRREKEGGTNHFMEGEVLC